MPAAPRRGLDTRGPCPAARRPCGRRQGTRCHVYRALYSETGAGYQELYSALSGADAAGVGLLGNHRQDIPELPDEVVQAIHSVVEHWPQPPTPVAGRSWSDLLATLRIAPRPSNRRLLRALLRKVAGPGGRARSGSLALAPLTVLSPLPTRNRRAVVLRALGVPQVLHPRESSTKRRSSCGLVHVYLDVSGSIGELKSALYGAVLDCRELVYPSVHLFSTVVHDISFAQLRCGECRTTHGTSIQCVAAHMAAHKVRRAVLLTDGFVGRPGLQAGQTLSRAVLGVALTPGCAGREDLQQHTKFWAQMTKENHP